MSVIPKAYSYVPGGTTGAVHIAGIRAFLAVSTYWSEVSFVGNLLTISNKTLPYVVLVTQASSNLFVSFSHDGTLFNPQQSVSGAYTFETTSGIGAGTDIAWIVETEDSLSWYSRSAGSSNTLTAPYAGALGLCFHVGKILTPDNRSDLADNIGVFGAFFGHAAIYNAGNSNWSLSTTAGGSQFLRGSTWEDVRIQTNFVRGWNQSLVTQYPSVPNRQYSAAMGDADQTERLPPIRIMGVTSGTACNTRYWRARYYAVGNTDSSGLVESTSVRVSSADPNIAWRHSAYSSATSGGTQTSPQNTIYLWSPTTTAL